MNRAASRASASSRSTSWGTACLCVWMAVGAGCAGHPVAPRSAANRQAEGLAEEQAADPTAPTPVAPRPERAESTESPGAQRDPHRTRRLWGWISLAIGAEAAVIAVTTSFMLLHEKSVLNDNCDAHKQCNAVGLDAKGAITETVPWNTGSWIVAAAGVGIGTVILLTSRSDSGKDTALSVTPTPGGAALGLRSQF
jgi:hypothetical protein